MRPLTVVELIEALIVAEPDIVRLAEDEMPEVTDKERVQNYIVGLCGIRVEPIEPDKPAHE